MDYVKGGTLIIQARTIKEVNSIDRVVVYADGCEREYLMPLPEERKEGEWLDNGDRYYRCSLCGMKDTDSWKFCRGCGARMKGE